MANEKRLIDANALKERAIRVSTVKEHCYMKAVGTHEIDKAPTVDAVEVVHGRWEWKPIGEKTWQLFCSACGSGDGTSEDYNYCPNCGAKMYGERKANCEIAEIVENCEDCGFCDKT